MKISFFGAAQMVSGSCFLLENNNIKILVDCGMFQGHYNNLNYSNFPFSPKEINCILLTHAHIDHSGRLPKLYKEGFRGEILCTSATYDLCKVMLEDSAHIQESEVEWKNRKNLRSGKELIEPLYLSNDVKECINCFKPIEYNRRIDINEDISIKFKDSGHMLGSVLIELWINENKERKKYVFTGDLGNINKPILKDPAIVGDADYLIMESTYGNRNHKKNSNNGSLLNIIHETARKGGNIVIPCFAVGRTQEILYELNKYKEKELLEEYNEIPVIVDSPLAIKATEIFKKNYRLYDEEALEMIEQGDDPLVFNNLKYSLSVENSKKINYAKNSKIIIASSGMCDGGRIRHHLKHNLWREDSSIVFVGYQATGSLGYDLINGTKEVKLFGESINVNCSIHQLDSFSGHADLEGLLGWLDKFNTIPKKIVLVHGEASSQINLKKEIIKRFNTKVLIPSLGDNIDLKNDKEFNDNIIISKNKYNNNYEIYQKITDTINKLDNIELNNKESDKIQYYLREISNIINKKKYMGDKIE